MMSAAEMNDTEALSRALALAGSVNIREGSSGCTAMHHAVRCGSLAALSSLLAAGADCTVKDNDGHSSFMRAVTHHDASALKIILDGIDTSTFCSLLHLQPFGLFESLEASCKTFAEKLLGFGDGAAAGLRPPAMGLLVKRLPAAAVMGLDTDSLSHFVAICCFVGCEHSAKSIMSRRPSVLQCIHSHGLSLLHIAVITSARSVVQQALLAAPALVNAPTRAPQPPLAGACVFLPRRCSFLAAHTNTHSCCAHTHSLLLWTQTLTLAQAAQTHRCTSRVWAPSPTTNAAWASCCLLGATPVCAMQGAARRVTC